MNNKIKNAIDAIAADKDFVDAVKAIEGGVKTTKGNYGKYLNVLTPFAKSKTALYVFSQALFKAGADSYGVQQAMNILTMGDVFDGASLL